MGRRKKQKACDPEAKLTQGQIANKDKDKGVNLKPKSEKDELPRSLRTILKLQEDSKNIKKRKKTNDNSLDRKKGESLFSYGKRVKQISKQMVRNEMKKTTHVNEKRKQYLKDRKEKLKKKSQKVKEPEDRKTFDNIKFGEVAETVPTITVKPKMKKKVEGNERTPAEQRIFDVERQRVIDNYRQLKVLRQERKINSEQNQN